MTKTNKRSRIVSILLVLTMLLSLMPSLELHAHAFWEDYDNGQDCEYCDHYHWAENCCDGCGFCTVDCNSDCFAEFHCNDCGECLFNTPFWCDQCYKCADCMEETHCSTCGKCYIGEDDQLCGECYKGPCCSITICDSCGFCDDCANDDSDPMHCSLCNACFGAVDECVDDDDTGVIHCIDCHASCEQCEECLLAKEVCEDCGLCKECCMDNSDAGGCPDGETCVESAEWEEHICPGCDGWVTDKEDEDEFCETCELCKECCEGNSDCSEGMCAMDTDYADHFCEDCGLCFHDSDPCEDGCDQRCKDCCLDAVKAMGCDHDDWCFSDSDFEDHLKAEHSGAGHTHIAASSWSANGTQHWHPCRYCDGKKLNAANHEYDAKGMCKVCGYISGSSIVITRQPRDIKCKTSIYDDYNEEPENGLLYYENHPITFSVSARSLRGDELTYQWYRKDNERPTAAPYKLHERPNHIEGVNTPTLRLSVSTQACQEDYSYYCVIGRKGDTSDTMKTAEAKLTASHAFSYNQGGEIVYTDDGEKVPTYKVTWVDKHGNTHNGAVGGVRKSEGHKLACLFEAGGEGYEAHYMTTGSKERIIPHKFAYDRSYDAVGGGKVDVLYCTVCDYPLYVKSHVHDYGWNWDCTGFGSIYEYTFNIGGSTKTVEQLILESGYAHPEKCKVPGCEEFIMVPHSWSYWHLAANPDTTGSEGGMAAECGICEYTKTKIDKDNDSEEIDHWTKDTALVTVKNGRATRMIVKPGDKIRLYPEERDGQKAIGWKVEYRREYNVSDSMAPVTRNWNTSGAKTMFKLVTNGSALEWGCTIPAFSAMGVPGGGQFFFEPVYAGCDHSGGTTVLNAKAQVCDRKGYTGDTACADCGFIIEAGKDIYPPANAGHTGTLQPLYYYGTNPSATTDPSHGGKRYNVRSGDCRHRAYEGDYRCSDCGGTVKGKTGDFKHSGPFELRDVRAATCTEKGYSGNQYCTAYDRISKKGSATPSLHEIAGNYKLVNEVKPGCATTGYSGDYQCTKGCGQIFRYGHVIDKLSHDWDGGKPATQGKSDGILYTCRRTGCGETRFVKNPTVPEYTVTVIKGTASVAAGTPITDKIAQNTVVTVTADAPDTGKVFDKWVVLEGNVTLADAAKATTTFTMPGNAVKLEATYKDAPPSHTHSYGTDWKYDDTNHWHECQCGDKADTAAHSFQWVIDKAATKEATGIKHEECTVCGAKRSENTEIPALQDYAVTVTGGTATVAAGTPITRAMEGVEVTVTAQAPEGKHFVKWVVKAGGITLANETSATTTFTMPANDVTIEAEFAENPVEAYTLTVIKGTASVAAGTPITDKIEQNTVVTVTANAPETGKVFDKWVVLEGNVTLADAAKATTTFTMPGNDVKLEATYKDAPPSHTHSYGKDWKYDDTNHWHECECGDKADVAAHSASEWIVDTAATETADGAKHKECTVCKKVLETATIPAAGSTHTHSYGADWKYDKTNHWHECQCGDKADTAAHSFQWVIDKAATKEATGIKHEECTICGAKRSENTVIDKLPDSGNPGNTGSGDNNTDKPGKDDSTKSPQTGDSSNLIGWLAALFVSGGVLTVLGLNGKKRKESEAE